MCNFENMKKQERKAFITDSNTKTIVCYYEMSKEYIDTTGGDEG